MIRKVSFRNFKAYRSLDLELEPFTVLVGPNAAGKTTLLEGLHLLSQEARLSMTPLLHSVPREGGGWVSYGVTPPAFELSVSGMWDTEPATVRLQGHQRDMEQPKKPEWEFTLSGDLKGKQFSIPGGPPSFPLARLRLALGATSVLRFEPRRLAEPSYSEEEIPRVSSDGGGLASVLAHLKLTNEELFNEIESALKQVVPTVRRIRIERAAVHYTAIRTISLDEQRHEVPEKRTFWGHQITFDMRGAKGVPTSAAGEGTLMALGLLTVLMGPSWPRLILLDDIEMALHPAAQGHLIEVLRKVQERDPELQIIATSHSPFVLNFLKPEEVRITSLAENGFARCVPMTSHPDFERWKGLMSPGEFWSTVGESWMHKPEQPSGQGEPATHE